MFFYAITNLKLILDFVTCYNFKIIFLFISYFILYSLDQSISQSLSSDTQKPFYNIVIYSELI